MSPLLLRKRKNRPHSPLMKIAVGFWLACAALVQAAGLEFSSLLTEVTAPADAATVTADFPFTNNAKKPISIAKTDSGCSCLKVEISGGKLKYAPGESGVVRATFEVGNFSGSVDKTIVLWTDSDPEEKPSFTLTTRVHIPVLIALEPKTVKWNIDSKATPQTVQIRMAEGETIRVVDVKSSNPAFKLDLKTVEDGKKYDLVVTPVDTGKPAIGVLRIQTDSKVSKHKVQNAFAVVRKPAAGETAATP